MSNQTEARAWTLRLPEGNLAHRLRAHWDFFAEYVASNMATALEYRASFMTQVFSMMLNDAFWVAFWWIYFSRFPVVNNWQLQDILTVWAVLATGFGLATGIFGNSLNLASMIARGEMDFYLTVPKNPLLHVLVSRMSIPSWGDLLFGIVVYLGFVHPSLSQLGLFLVLVLLVGVVFVSFSVLVESLAFFIGGSQGLSRELVNALITFGTYPMGIFDGVVKVILFTLVPAGFISYIPVMLLHSFDWTMFMELFGFAIGLTLLSWLVFFVGLRRYESGNLLSMRG